MAEVALFPPLVIDGHWCEPGFNLCFDCPLEDCRPWSARNRYDGCLRVRYHASDRAYHHGDYITDFDGPIPFPDQLDPPVVVAPLSACIRCSHVAECRELSRTGMPVLCERVGTVSVGNTLVQV